MQNIDFNLTFCNVTNTNSTKSKIRNYIHKQKSINIDEKLNQELRFYLDSTMDRSFTGILSEHSDKQYIQSLIQNMINTNQNKQLENNHPPLNEENSYLCQNRNQSSLLTLWHFIISLAYNFIPFLLIKMKVDFIFLVHIRYEDDYTTHAPYFSFLKKILPKKAYIWFLSHMPPVMLDIYTNKEGIKGLLISSTKLPHQLLNGKKTRNNEIHAILNFISNICKPNHKNIVVSLGAWWPIVSLHGKLFEKALPKNHHYLMTTGHTATLYSMVKTAENLIKKSFLPKDELNIAIIGCGNIGFFVAQALLVHGVQLTLIDINETKLLKVKNHLVESFPKSTIHHHVFTHDSINKLLHTCHFGICATSNTKEIIKKDDIPEFFIFIDDSRPEAIPRFDYGDNKYTLEGGLIHIEDFCSSFNFGFGNDNNLLGCLSEGYILALDNKNDKELEPTKSISSIDQFNRMATFCQKKNIKPGDYKMGELKIEESTLIQAIQYRHQRIIK